MTPTLSDFIAFYKEKRTEIEKHEPSQKRVSEFFYINGMIDAAETIDREIKANKMTT